MKKRLLCLALAATMVVGTAMTANAEEFYGSQDWKVSFNGDKMESTFDSGVMTEEILQIQPGDTITLKVALSNDSKEKTDWYMTNEVIQTLEDTQSVAEGGAYTYILSYSGPDGEEILFSSEAVGGEGQSAAGEGLHQATDALEEYFYLDQLGETESGYVQLVVKLDGETQGNAYQDTLAKLSMNFAVEKVNADKIYKTSAKTGDFAPMMMVSTVALAGGLILLFAAVVLTKKRRTEGV